MRRVALSLLLFALVACNRAERSAETPVFIISIDTLRSDRLPAYGYRAGSTPAIDALRADSILFEHAYSAVPQTLPSHSTILSGLQPTHHGVRDNIGYVLSEQMPSLPNDLKLSGYVTGGAISSYVLRRSTGIAHGFDFFDDDVERGSTTEQVATRAERDGDLTRQALESWIAQQSSRRIFGFLHLYEPHAPYVGGYDAEVKRADAIVGRFIDTLKARNLYDDALIIVASDHGEGLGEHGEDEHGLFVYRYALQVPLLVKLPKQSRKGEAVSAPVGLVDVAATIYDVLGLEPKHKLDGVSLLSQNLDPARKIYSETYYTRFHFGWSELTSLIGSDRHYIAAPRSELYDPRTDPAEMRNLLNDDRRTAAAMRTALQAMIVEPAAPTAIDPEDQRKLASLGYLGSSGGGSGARPDPKDKIGNVRLFRDALAQFERGDDKSCQQTLRALIAEAPTFIDAWGLLSQSLRRTGDDAGALQALQEAMRRFPGDPHVTLSVADLLLQMNRLPEAKAHAELLLRDSPVLAHETLSRIALAAGDLATARREIDEALKDAATRSNTLQIAASIAERQGDWAGLVNYTDRIVNAARTNGRRVAAGTQLKRGEALLQLQRVPEAEQAFRAETTENPQVRPAWAQLALVVGAQGRRDDARALLLQGLRQNPDTQMRSLAMEAAQIMSDAQLQQQIAATPVR